MGKGDDARWNAAFSAASRLAPAEEWRESIARALREATSAELTHVITCPPGDWGRYFRASTYPADHADLTRIAQTFLPRIEACGEGFAHLIARYGLVCAPLDVARHRPLAEEMRGAFLSPAGMRGWVMTSIVDDAGALIGVLAVGTRRGSPAVLEQAAARLRDLSSIAATTLGGAIRLAAGCSVSAAPPPSLDGLTAREREIAGLVAQGLRNANIAARLGIAEATVAVHLKRIYDKLDITSRVDLAVRCRG
jgi:DNA-binding CsgD family transcriptional regulator